MRERERDGGGGDDDDDHTNVNDVMLYHGQNYDRLRGTFQILSLI